MAENQTAKENQNRGNQRGNSQGGSNQNNSNQNNLNQNGSNQNKNNNNRNRYHGHKKNYTHKGMIYKANETGLVHDWDCTEVKNGNLADFEELKEVELYTGMLCPKCGKSLLYKKYTDDVDEGRAVNKFIGDSLSTEFLCEMYETYHIFPYVYNGAMKLSYKDEFWKISKSDRKYILYHNTTTEDTPGWFNDHWEEFQTFENVSLQDVFQIILSFEKEK